MAYRRQRKEDFTVTSNFYHDGITISEKDITTKEKEILIKAAHYNAMIEAGRKKGLKVTIKDYDNTEYLKIFEKYKGKN